MAKKKLPWQEKISLKNFSCDEQKTYELDESCPSVQGLLEELEAGLDKEDRGGGRLHLHLLVVRRSGSHYGDYLLFEGSIMGVFGTPCVRCLVPTRCSLETDFFSCFLSPHHQQGDSTSIYIDGRDRELYFYHDGVADLQEVLHENIFINVDPLPLHDPDCRGLCPVCGGNLNTTSCSH